MSVNNYWHLSTTDLAQSAVLIQVSTCMRNMDSMSVCTTKNIYVQCFRDLIWLKSKHDNNNNDNKKNTVTLIKIFHSTACIHITQQDVNKSIFPSVL